MNESTIRIKADKEYKSTSASSKLSGMLSGRIGNNLCPDKALDAMMRSTSPETRNSGELTFVPLDALLPFPAHPFKLYEGVKLNELIESIKEIGVVNAIIIRKVLNQPGLYQILSGHNRANAAQLAGLKQIKSEVVDVDDDTAALIVVDSNFKQRQTLLPSERVFGYKMQMDALRHQGKRTDLFETYNKSVKTRDIVGKENNLSGFQITNYLRLTQLIPELLDMVDAQYMPLKAAVMLSYIDKEKQKQLYTLITEKKYRIDYGKASKLRTILSDESVTDETLIQVFEEKGQHLICIIQILLTTNCWLHLSLKVSSRKETSAIIL